MFRIYGCFMLNKPCPELVSGLFKQLYSFKYRILMCIAVFMLCGIDCSAKMREKDYVNMYCTGAVEYTLPDKTRIDCLTDEYAIEFDYAEKWAESVGQSLYYSKMTGKKPACAIIIKKPSDMKYIQRIIKSEEHIKIFIIPAFRTD